MRSRTRPEGVNRGVASRRERVWRRWCAAAAVLGLALADISPAHGQAPYRPGIVQTKDLEIPLSDGSLVRADLYQPTGLSGPLPTVVLMFPYKKDDPNRIERDTLYQLVRAGFAGLVVDVRGTGGSPGEFCLLCRREIRDGYETVEWAARQPWSDGRIGMWGYSYSGIYAGLVAALRPPHLRAIVSGSAYNEPYRDLFYPGGIRASEDLAAITALFQGVVPYSRIDQETDPTQGVLMFADALGHPSAVGAEFLMRDTYDEWWRERSFEDKAHLVDVPTLHVTGWHDVYARGTPLNYLLMNSRKKAMLIGPWGHIGPFTPTATMGEAEKLFATATQRWFDIFLRTPPGAEREGKLAGYPRLLSWDMDPTSPNVYDGTSAWRGQWRTFHGWPPRHEHQVLNLCPDPPAGNAGAWPSQGSLQDAPCLGAGMVPVAATPLELTGGQSVFHDIVVKGEVWDPYDQRANTAATAFIGPVLEQAVTITGGSRVDFTATTGGSDADWIAKVIDIAPDGAGHQVARGWLKASHRREDARRPFLYHSHTNPERVQPGQPYRLAIEVWPTSYRVAAGHRIALLLQAADTRKVLPSNESAASFVLIDPANPATLTIPLRTDPGRAIDDPLRAYTIGPAE